MQYASEAAGALTSLHLWKPVTPERFISLLHFHSTIAADKHGHDAISQTSIIVNSETTVTVWYRRKDRQSTISSPVLLTLEGGNGKTLAFEATDDTLSKQVAPAASVIAAVRAHQDKQRYMRLESVARLAATASKLGAIMVIAPDAKSAQQATDAFQISGVIKACPVNVFVSTPMSFKGDLLRGGFNAFWFHDAGNLAQSQLNDLMDELAASKPKSGSWMAFTGHEPRGWKSPDGLPELL